MSLHDKRYRSEEISPPIGLTSLPHQVQQMWRGCSVRGMFPRVFGDEFGDKFGDKFGDSLNLLTNLVINFATNLVIHQNW